MSYRNEHRLLNELIELCRDEELMLRAAASHVKDADARALLEELAESRAAFAADLLPHAQRLGGDAPAGGTARGALRRRWLAIKSHVPGVTDRTMMADAEHAESAALAAYARVLEDLLQPSAREVVERQWDELRTVHDRMRALIVH
jgi:uncharacterized protein (TIGR02284 family)